MKLVILLLASTSSRRGSEDITNPYRHRTREQTSFIEGIDDKSLLIQRERESKLEEAWRSVKSKFPKFNPAN